MDTDQPGQCYSRSSIVTDIFRRRQHSATVDEKIGTTPRLADKIWDFCDRIDDSETCRSTGTMVSGFVVGLYANRSVFLFG